MLKIESERRKGNIIPNKNMHVKKAPSPENNELIGTKRCPTKY